MSSPRVETVEAAEENKSESVEKSVEKEKRVESCSKSAECLPSSSEDAPKNDRDASAESPISRKRKHPQDSEATKVPKSSEGQDALVKEIIYITFQNVVNIFDKLVQFQVRVSTKTWGKQKHLQTCRFIISVLEFFSCIINKTIKNSLFKICFLYIGSEITICP